MRCCQTNHEALQMKSSKLSRLLAASKCAKMASLLCRSSITAACSLRISAVRQPSVLRPLPALFSPGAWAFLDFIFILDAVIIHLFPKCQDALARHRPAAIQPSPLIVRRASCHQTEPRINTRIDQRLIIGVRLQVLNLRPSLLDCYWWRQYLQST